MSLRAKRSNLMLTSGIASSLALLAMTINIFRKLIKRSQCSLRRKGFALSRLVNLDTMRIDWLVTGASQLFTLLRHKPKLKGWEPLMQG